MPPSDPELLQGTLDLLILKIAGAGGDHGMGDSPPHLANHQRDICSEGRGRCFRAVAPHGARRAGRLRGDNPKPSANPSYRTRSGRKQAANRVGAVGAVRSRWRWRAPWARRPCCRKRQFEQELDEELRSYVELQAAAKVERGMSPKTPSARHGGSLAAWIRSRRTCRDVSLEVVDTLVQDIRYAFRALNGAVRLRSSRNPHAPWGVSAKYAILTVVDAGGLLKPLYPDPQTPCPRGNAPSEMARRPRQAPTNFYDWREQSRSFCEDAQPSTPIPTSCSMAPAEHSVSPARMSQRGFFSLLGTRMERGTTSSTTRTAPATTTSVKSWLCHLAAILRGAPYRPGQAVTLNGAPPTRWSACCRATSRSSAKLPTLSRAKKSIRACPSDGAARATARVDARNAFLVGARPPDTWGHPRTGAGGPGPRRVEPGTALPRVRTRERRGGPVACNSE